jgi:hypothetical protein
MRMNFGNLKAPRDVHFVQLIPAKLNFGTQPVGTRSLARRITLTNKGSATVKASFGT